MGLLDELMGGGQQQGDFQDFVSRYQQGAPHEGIDEQEAAQRYGQVAGEIDPSTYQQSAQESLANMSPDQRAEYGQQLSSVAEQQGVSHGWDGSSDPQSLARMTTNVHQQAPDLLGSLLGGGGGGAGGVGGALGGLLGGGGGGGAGGALGGLLGGGSGSGVGGSGGNPIMKAALGGIAAMAAKRMMGGPGGA
jgi:hypothetical protein